MFQIAVCMLQYHECLFVPGSNDPKPAPLRLLLQLPTEAPARVQAGGAPFPQNGV